MRNFVMIVATCILTASFANAAPVSLKVKSGIIETPSGATVDVDGGVYTNEEGRDVIVGTMNALKSQNATLLSELNDANDNLNKYSGYVPGFPPWAAGLISGILSIATIVLGYFAVVGFPVIK